MQLTLKEAKERYGEIVDGKWLDEAKWCVFVRVPPELSIINAATGIIMRRIYCNVDMADALIRVFNAIVQYGLTKDLFEFNGCFMIRSVRGHPEALSTHAYALAIDFNASENPLGQPGSMNLDIVECFKAEGFSWGGDFSRKDPMHVSFAWE